METQKAYWVVIQDQGLQIHHRNEESGWYVAGQIHACGAQLISL